MISADVNADVKQQEVKKPVAISYNFLLEASSNLEIKCKTGVYFSFNFNCFLSARYCPLRTGKWGKFTDIEFVECDNSFFSTIPSFLEYVAL